MSSKDKFWITTVEGTRGLVEGTEERDKWTPLGWRVVSEEPSDTDFVYMRHPSLDKPARFAYGAAETWQQMGWTFSAPPEPVDVTKDPVLFVQPEQSETKPESKKTSAPAAGTDKNAKE